MKPINTDIFSKIICGYPPVRLIRVLFFCRTETIESKPLTFYALLAT